MDPYTAQILEERASAALQDAELTTSAEARSAIARIPNHLMTPAVIAAIATSLYDKSNALGEHAKELAQGYLFDLIDDMQATGEAS